MDFRRDRLHVDLGTRDITARSALDSVRVGDADLCLVSHFGNVDLEGLSSLELVSDPFVAIVRSDHPLANRDSIWMRDIGSEVVWTHTAPGVRTFFGAMEDILVRNGASPQFMPLPWTNARKLYNSFAFFEGGIHVNLGSVVKYSVPLSLKGYKVLRFLDENAYLPLYAHWRQDTENPAVALAVQSLKDTVEQMGKYPYCE